MSLFEIINYRAPVASSEQNPQERPASHALKSSQEPNPQKTLERTLATSTNPTGDPYLSKEGKGYVIIKRGTKEIKEIIPINENITKSMYPPYSANQEFQKNNVSKFINDNSAKLVNSTSTHVYPNFAPNAKTNAVSISRSKKIPLKPTIN